MGEKYNAMNCVGLDVTSFLPTFPKLNHKAPKLLGRLGNVVFVYPGKGRRVKNISNFIFKNDT